ncbi:MAG: leucine-rich repeat domain-containing protein [Chitinophagales bacterium]
MRIEEINRLISECLETQTTSLDLSRCEIRDLNKVPRLEECTHLKELELDLHHNQISNISCLAKLSNLSSLDLSDNQISDISCLAKLSNLSSLFLRDNQISDISFLAKLENLSTLDLHSNQISDISCLAKLENLSTLDLSFNQISDISCLAKLENLSSLYLRSNQISDISCLAKLENLSSLYLRSNQISNISCLAKLENLNTLDLDYNKISDISLAFLNSLPKLKYLYLYQNPIKNVDKTIFGNSWHHNCLPDLRNYLEDAEKGKTINNEVKILLVGNGSVGKTQIAKHLVEQEKFVFDEQHNSTHAICLLERKLACSNLVGISHLRLQLWDFAGQDLYHATHRLFMQTKAVFFLVWDAENECTPFHTHKGKQYKNEEIDYWLHYIKHFGQNSPILVLQNKTDIPKHKKRPYTKMAQKAYQKRYNIKAFLQVSAKADKKNGFDVLESKIQAIFKADKKLQEDLLIPLPTSWVAVRTKCREEMQKGKNSIDVSSFENWCEVVGVRKSAASILRFLHNTGVVFYKEDYFHQQIILNQAWAIEAIYKILDRDSHYFEILEHQEGKLMYQDLCEIWPQNSDVEKELFIDFMLSCEFCFELDKKKDEYKPLSKRSFVVPQLLPSKPEYIEECYVLEYALEKEETKYYDFLPSVYIQRFIVRANKFADFMEMWPSGIFLEYETEGSAAIVEADYEKKKIVIRMSENAVDLRAAIFEELGEIEGEGKKEEQTLIVTKHIRSAKAFLRKGFTALKPNKENSLEYGTVAHKEHLESLFIRGELEECLRGLLKATKHTKQLDLYKNVVLQSQRFYAHKKGMMTGLEKDNDFEVARTRMSSVLFDLLEKYEVF